ncbi:WD40-repeat-containing domain protein [Lipomyces arxii]|uniref:WD40-repeat-containing domain protein n=1 Tax=Lipomyces arxii TaxID=56418 RepID=UPI0034CF4CEA
MKVHAQHVSIGANRVPGAATVCDASGTVAFAADRYVALWRPEDKVHGVRNLLKGHSDAVSAITSIRLGVIASGSTDGEIKVWSKRSGGDKFDYNLLSTISFHKRSIHCLAATPDGKFLIAGGGDATISVWRTEHLATSDPQPVQVIPLGSGYYPLVIAVETVFSSDRDISYILAVGATNASIQVFTSYAAPTLTFSKVAALKGHEDWIRSLTFKQFRENDGSVVLMLASGSQDRYIRLWKILPFAQYKKSHESGVLSLTDPMLSNTLYRFFLTPKNSKEIVVDLSGELYVASSLSRPSSRNSVASMPTESSIDAEYVVVFHALLMGHDDWIFSLAWHPSPTDRRLLSASADSSLMIWQPDDESGIWLSQGRFGDVSTKGASSATGSSGGFWVALWDQKMCSNWIATIGKSGGWRVFASESESDRWTPITAATGHAREVTGISWAPGGEYLLTSSTDQTTRLLAEWKQTSSSLEKSWHEFARPQIHGYDMVTVASLSPTEFVSAGDEKILRVFEMSNTVATLLEKLCGIDLKAGQEALPDSANVPSLGLSNKAVTAGGSVDDNDEQEARPGDRAFDVKVLTTLTTPPLESQLQRHTLFPEVEKLYGHGYEISTAKFSHDKKIVATTCRANSAVHAVIRLFDVATWHDIKPSLAEAHTLTITGLGFSNDDKYMVSVGRDRQLVIWELNDESSRTDGYYKIQQKEPRGHSRIIWDVSWAPSQLIDVPELDYVFATASRDKTVKIWTRTAEHKWACVVTQAFSAPVTAVDFKAELVNKHAYLLVGLDNGNVYIFELKVNNGALELKLVLALDDQLTPAMSISQVEWRPTSQDSDTFDFAVASEDSSVRIYTALMD